MSNITETITPLDVVSAVNEAITDVSNKQDELVSGTNIKTINSTSLLGEGNIDVATTSQGSKADTALQPSDVVSTYNSSGTSPINGTAVASAISGLSIPIVDQTHSASSTNAQSGTAVASAISGKEDKAPSISSLTTSGTIALNDNTNYLITPTGNITFTLPTVTNTTINHKIEVEINMSSTVYSIDLGLGNNPNYFNKKAPNLSTTGVYNLLFQYSPSKSVWYCGGAPIGGV